MKPRLNVYLDDHTAAQVALLSKRPGINKSRIVNDALDRFFNPEKDQESMRALVRRLDRMSKALERLDRNQSVGVETLALFIRYFLTITPPLPEADQAAAHALGRERFEMFAAQVGRRLAQDRNLLSEVLETIAETRPDLFATDTETIDKAASQRAAAELPDSDLPPLRPVRIAEPGEWDDENPDELSGDLNDFELGEENDHVG